MDLRPPGQGSLSDMLKTSILPDVLQFPGFAQKPSLKDDITDKQSKFSGNIDDIIFKDSKLANTLTGFKQKSSANGTIDQMLGNTILPPILQFPGFAQKPALKNDKTDVVNKSKGDLNKILQDSTQKKVIKTKSEGSLQEILKKYSKNPSVKK
jgi:hypothetical protein